MNQSKRDRIAARAHQIWEEEGRPHNKSEEHWRRAEQEVAREERSGQMGGEVPASENVDRRPAPPVEAAPPVAGADTAAPDPAPESAAKKPKRRTGRTRGARPEPQQR